LRHDAIELRQAEPERSMTAPEPFSSLIDARVTKRLGEMKNRIIELGEDLQDTIHSRVGTCVSAIQSDLESHSCRIAVIGQIKAGKSSLINALIRRPELLPTDINPSTAVITKLYFGAPAEQNNTALFHFFSDEEWEHIMAGGRAGSMTVERNAAISPRELRGSASVGNQFSDRKRLDRRTRRTYPVSALIRLRPRLCRRKKRAAN
jgi:hypothetical protein